MIALRYAACAMGVTLALSVAVGVAKAGAPTHGASSILLVNGSEIPDPPDTPCNLGHRLNVEFVDGWMFECACSVLATGFHCEWNLVGQVTSAAARKARKRIALAKQGKKRTIPVLVIRVHA